MKAERDHPFGIIWLEELSDLLIPGICFKIMQEEGTGAGRDRMAMV